MAGQYKVVLLFCIPWTGMFAAIELGDAGYWPLSLALAVLCPVLHNELYHQE